MATTKVLPEPVLLTVTLTEVAVPVELVVWFCACWTTVIAIAHPRLTLSRYPPVTVYAEQETVAPLEMDSELKFRSAPLVPTEPVATTVVPLLSRSP